MTPKLYFVRIAKIDMKSLILLKKKVQGRAEKNAQRLSVEIHPVFVAFNISRDLSARTSFEHKKFQGAMCEGPFFVDFYKLCRQTSMS